MGCKLCVSRYSKIAESRISNDAGPRTPAPSLGFRHDGASCHDSADAVVPPRSITMEGVTRTTAVSPSRDANKAVAAEGSSAGSITEYTSRRQPKRPTGDRVEASLLLPLKKRAMCEGSSSHSGNSDDNDSSLVPPKKRRMDYVDTGSKAGAARACGMTLVRSHHEPSSSNAITAVTSEPPREKLMHDAIRSSARSDEHHLYVPRPLRQRPGSRLLIMEEGETSAQGAAAAAKKTTTTAKKKGKAPAQVDGAPMATARITMALNYRLDSLGATRPRRLYVKRLHRSDVDRNQNRLLISCKREVLHKCPITRFFTKEETRHVQDQAKNGGLAPVYAFDRLGRMYKIRLRYLDSNGGYRFIGEWGDFLSENGFYLNANSKWTRQVDVELWAFRSWELPNGEESGHPDGALGLLLLPYEDRVEVVGRGEEQRMPALPANETETGHAGQALGRQAPATAPVQEEALADARAEQGEAVARDMTLDEVVQAVGEEMADPVIGLLMLARSEDIEEENCLQDH